MADNTRERSGITVKQSEVQIPLWLGIAWVGLPLAWGAWSPSPFFLAGVAGLSKALVGGPILVALVALSLLLSIRRWRNVVSVAAAGGFLFACALSLAYGVANSGFFLLMLVGGALMRAAYRVMDGGP